MNLLFHLFHAALKHQINSDSSREHPWLTTKMTFEPLSSLTVKCCSSCSLKFLKALLMPDVNSDCGSTSGVGDVTSAFSRPPVSPTSSEGGSASSAESKTEFKSWAWSSSYAAPEAEWISSVCASDLFFSAGEPSFTDRNPSHKQQQQHEEAPPPVSTAPSCWMTSHLSLMRSSSCCCRQLPNRDRGTQVTNGKPVKSSIRRMRTVYCTCLGEAPKSSSCPSDSSGISTEKDYIFRNDFWSEFRAVVHLQDSVFSSWPTSSCGLSDWNFGASTSDLIWPVFGVLSDWILVHHWALCIVQYQCGPLGAEDAFALYETWRQPWAGHWRTAGLAAFSDWCQSQTWMVLSLSNQVKRSGTHLTGGLALNVRWDQTEALLSFFLKSEMERQETWSSLWHTLVSVHSSFSTFDHLQ